MQSSRFLPPRRFSYRAIAIIPPPSHLCLPACLPALVVQHVALNMGMKALSAVYWALPILAAFRVALLLQARCPYLPPNALVRPTAQRAAASYSTSARHADATSARALPKTPRLSPPVFMTWQETAWAFPMLVASFSLTSSLASVLALVLTISFKWMVMGHRRPGTYRCVRAADGRPDLYACTRGQDVVGWQVDL